MFKIRHLLLLLAAVTLTGCIAVPQKVPLSDPAVTPLLRAAAAVDRTSLGFSSVPTNTDVVLIRPPGGGFVRLRVGPGASHTIAFRKTANGYRWVGEREIYTGPKTYSDVDGVYHEEICITYQTEPLWHGPVDRIYLTYDGPDPQLASRFDLTLEKVRRVLDEWQHAR